MIQSPVMWYFIPLLDFPVSIASSSHLHRHLSSRLSLALLCSHRLFSHGRRGPASGSSPFEQSDGSEFVFVYFVIFRFACFAHSILARAERRLHSRILSDYPWQSVEMRAFERQLAEDVETVPEFSVCNAFVKRHCLRCLRSR